MLDTCQPNIILVEKAASRETQELIRKQGITLVLDMKPHRMERIVRCTGSKVVSLGEALMRPDVVKECDNFRIEKFVEDINSEGKKSSKNLLFLEGLPKPLGCTVSTYFLITSLNLPLFTITYYCLREGCSGSGVV
jgi:1-phosphatidylinositol-3-phosphate 5-kinase